MSLRRAKASSYETPPAEAAGNIVVFYRRKNVVYN
jgi:hypothetical protein